MMAAVRQGGRLSVAAATWGRVATPSWTGDRKVAAGIVGPVSSCQVAATSGWPARSSGRSSFRVAKRPLSLGRRYQGLGGHQWCPSCAAAPAIGWRSHPSAGAAALLGHQQGCCHQQGWLRHPAGAQQPFGLSLQQSLLSYSRPCCCSKRAEPSCSCSSRSSCTTAGPAAPGGTTTKVAEPPYKSSLLVQQQLLYQQQRSCCSYCCCCSSTAAAQSAASLLMCGITAVAAPAAAKLLQVLQRQLLLSQQSCCCQQHPLRGCGMRHQLLLSLSDRFAIVE